ncbi:DUF4276 family protein [Brevundimonas sp. UBA7534]|uniref:DUF4276 family protein n=1 Tax=Brevundimonas sp. UBA7534 TaxID=1946138 RepID=UPI0025BFAAEC|nr:DUF4276 family protein [Brevundimonas sp. UBA7534]
MTYVSWGAIYEGSTDQAYFEVLIPRLMEDLVVSSPARNTVIPATPAVRLKRGGPNDVAVAVCGEGDAYHLIFIHADTGGRALAQAAAGTAEEYKAALLAQCGWPPERCIVIAPRHETEAWLLADPMAVTAVLGYTGNIHDVGLPRNAAEAERIVDPKATLKAAADAVRGRRRPQSSSQMFPAIAQRQDLNSLRHSDSFRQFENQVIAALRSLNCIH